MYDMMPLPLGRIANICRLWLTKLIFVGYGQLNSTTVLDFAPVMYDTSYLNMQHLGGPWAYFFSF